MHNSNELDLSIQLEQNNSFKSKEQELAELVELTKKIADSDRTNDMLRQLKKNKNLELQKIKKAHKQTHLQQDQAQKEYEIAYESLKTAKVLSKIQSEVYQASITQNEEKIHREKGIQLKNSQIVKQNEKLEKKIAHLQQQLKFNVVQTNKEKQNYYLQIKAKRQEQNQAIQQNQKRIFDLQKKCQSTKTKAEDLENQLKKQIITSKELNHLASERERELDNQKKQRENHLKRQEDSKRMITKMMNLIKKVEDEIDGKKMEVQRLQEFHLRMERELERVDEIQKALDEMVTHRRDMVLSLKKSSQKVKREQDQYLKQSLQL